MFVLPLRWRWLALTALGLLPGQGAAAGPTPDPAPLTLPQLIVEAEAGNKDLQAARYAVDIGQARLRQAGLRANPTLELGVRSDAAFANDGEYEHTLALSQSFPIAGRLLRQKDVARVDVALAQAEVAEAERQLADEVAATAYRWLVLDRQLASRGELLDAQTQLLRTTRARFKAAEVSELDVNTVQLDRDRLVEERRLLATQQDTLRATLNARLGRDADAPLALSLATPAAEAGIDAADWQRRALARRPDLRSALLSVDRADAERALAKAQRWQDWQVGLELSQGRQVITGAPPQGSDRLLGLRVSIPLPLVKNNQGALAEADAARAQALAHVEALRLRIGSEVTAAFAETTRLQAALASYEQSLLPVSARTVALARQGYRQGLVPMADVVQTQRQQAELQSDYLSTLDQYLQAVVRLHTAVGDYVDAAATP